MNSIVKKNNQVISASYNLSIHEQQCLLYCLTQIHTNAQELPDLFRIEAKLYAELFGISVDKSYQTLKAVADTLFERYVVIDDLKTRWISSIRYKEGEGTVEIRIASDMKPYLIQLKKEFTTYDIRHTAGFTSKYAIRIYEWVIQWQNANEKQVEVFIPTLRDRLMLGDKYTRINDLQKKVIQPAITDINSHSNLKLSYKMVKKGRKFISVVFSFSVKDRSNRDITEKELLEKAKPGESRQEAMSRIKKLQKSLL